MGWRPLRSLLGGATGPKSNVWQDLGPVNSVDWTLNDDLVPCNGLYHFALHTHIHASLWLPPKILHVCNMFILMLIHKLCLTTVSREEAVGAVAGDVYGAVSVGGHPL